MIDELNKRELKRRAKAMSDEEQAIMLTQFKSDLISEEHRRRLQIREDEINDIAKVFIKYREG